MAVDNSDDLVISISTDLATIRRSLKRLEGDIGGSNKAIQRQYDQLGQRIDGMFAKSARNAEASIARMTRATGDASLKFAKVFAIAGSARGAQSLIDSSIKVQNSLKVAGLEGENLKSVYTELYASANRNGVPIAELATLYGRAATAAKELGASQTDLTKFSDTVAMSLMAGGGTAQEASGALLQLGQAIGGGRIQMEEYGSLLDGARPLLQAVAAGIGEAGGSVAKLTTLVKSGKISSKAFFDGAIAGAPTLAKALESSEQTISSRMVRLQNVLIDAAGRFDGSTKAGNAFGEAIDKISGEIASANFDNLAGQLKTIAGYLKDGAGGLQSWSEYIGKISGLNKIGSSILPEDGVNVLGGALTINSTTTAAEKEAALAQKRLDLEKQIADLKSNPLNPTAPYEIRMLQGQLDALPRAQPTVTVPIAAPEQKRPEFPHTPTPKTIKPVSLADYPVVDPADAEKARKAFDALIKTVDDRIGQTKLETQLLGTYGTAAETARLKLDLLQKSQEDGRTLSPDQLKALDAKVAVYGKMADMLAKANLQQDLLEQRRLNSLSPQDQQVYGQLKQYGLPTDLSSPQANQIRQQLQSQELKSTADSFADNLSSALVNSGGKIGEALGRTICGRERKIKITWSFK